MLKDVKSKNSIHKCELFFIIQNPFLIRCWIWNNIIQNIIMHSFKSTQLEFTINSISIKTAVNNLCSELNTNVEQKYRNPKVNLKSSTNIQTDKIKRYNQLN